LGDRAFDCLQVGAIVAELLDDLLALAFEPSDVWVKEEITVFKLAENLVVGGVVHLFKY
jgi:hypothetical protein